MQAKNVAILESRLGKHLAERVASPPKLGALLTSLDHALS